MTLDVLIVNGRVIDPARGIDQIGRVGIYNGRIVQLPEEGEISAKLTVDAQDCLVVPGLVDAHQHINYHSADWGAHPDLSTIPNGITAVADAGTSGASNCLALLERLSQYSVKSRIFVNASPLGQATLQFNEPLNPDQWDVKRMEYVFQQGGEKIVGLKIRLSKGIVSDFEPLSRLIQVAEKLNTKVLVHPSNPPLPQKEILNQLRKGDIYCHLYQGVGHTILDENGKVIPELWAAKERGVILDAAHGAANYNFEVARKAFSQGVVPDVISSDTTSTNTQRAPMYNLTDVMSKFLMLGMDVPQIIACTTCNPARVLGMEDKIGSLKPGCCGDVTILKLKNGEFTFKDSQKNTQIGTQMFETQLVFLDGQLSYRAPEFRGC